MALIPPVGSGVTPVARPLPRVEAPATTESSGSAGFQGAIGDALEALSAGEAKTDALAQQAATGRLRNVEDYLISATEQQLNMQLTVAVRNKAVEAFNEIMRMQV